MKTRFITSPDGTRIAYDHCGAGPALVLIHGGGGSRQEWHEAGYVDRLRREFTVIAIDLRGHGQSDLPTVPAAYTTEKMGQDILAVVDDCGFNSFILWGMSFGSKVCRYLAVRSDRVIKLVLISAQLGLGVSGQLRQDALEFVEHWPPILEALQGGGLKMSDLSQADQATMKTIKVPVVLAWVQAMLQWPEVIPADFHCPTLWLAGSEDHRAMESIKIYQEELEGSMVQVHIVDSLDHQGLFDDIEAVFPIMLAFSR